MSLANPGSPGKWLLKQCVCVAMTINATLWVDYFQTEEVLNIPISIQNQSDFFCQLIKCNLFLVSMSAFCLLLPVRKQNFGLSMVRFAL